MQVPITDTEHDAPSVLQECPSILDRIIGCSPAAIRLKALVDRAAVGANPVLILGKSGTGKNLVAECIHLISHSSREGMYFVDAAQPLGTLPGWDVDLLQQIKGWDSLS